jgi:ABC-2 type transport system ATP-binding protein
VTRHGGTILLGSGLTKRFRGVDALDHVDISLFAGESVALLGPNGAGKTTLLRILAGVVPPSDGEIARDAGQQARIGWVPHDPAVYRRLTARENIALFAGLEGRDGAGAVTDLLERADLERFADRSASELSTGTLQRLNLVIALAGRPEVLLLDEPTATLSPDQVHRLWAWLDELRREDGVAILFSTQSVDEAAKHGQRMVILDDGHVVFAGTTAELIATHGAGDPEATADDAFLNLVGAAR